MENKNYSSETVKLLLENNRWNFWKKDWSKRIIVQWEGNAKQPLKKFSKQVAKLVGNGFLYEPALNGKPTQFIVTSKGLEQLNKG